VLAGRLTRGVKSSRSPDSSGSSGAAGAVAGFSELQPAPGYNPTPPPQHAVFPGPTTGPNTANTGTNTGTAGTTGTGALDDEVEAIPVTVAPESVPSTRRDLP
jgi:hypothetical protein